MKKPLSDDFKHPRTGIGVMIFRNGKVLMHKRRGSHGSGEYSFPGGHLEYGESINQCAIRETREETGIEIKNIKFLFLANVKKYGGKHYVHIGLIADWKNGQPTNLEPAKSSEWFWTDPRKPPKPLFEMVRLSIIAHKTGKAYFDS